MDSLGYTVYNENDYLNSVGPKTDLTTTVLLSQLQPASVVVVTVGPDGSTSIIPEHQIHSASSTISPASHCQPHLEDTNSSSGSNDKQLVIVPLSSATGKKRRRDWSKVNRKFHAEWTEQFAVVERDERPLCLICQKVISQMKVSLIRAHYRKVHADFEARFTFNTDIRSLEISRLASLVTYTTMGSSSSSFNRPNDDSDLDDDDEDNDFSSEDLQRQQTNTSDDQQTLHLLDSNSLDLSDHFLGTSSYTQESPIPTATVQTQQPQSFFSHHHLSKRPRRDWNKVQRKFHNQWTEQYLVVEAGQEARPICLVCHRLINAMKVHNIRRHYLTLHATYFEHHFPTSSAARKAEVTRLIENFKQNQSFVSILATPELAELELGDDEGASDEFDEPVGSEVQTREHQQSDSLAASTPSYSVVPLNQQIQQSSSSSVQHQPLPSANYQKTLTIDKMEQAFTHLDRFLSIIEQNDANVQRSFKVRTAIEVVVDCYKHLLKDMKSPGGGHHLVANQSQQQQNQTSTINNNINNSIS